MFNGFGPRNLQQDERTPKHEYLIARSQLTERSVGIPIEFFIDLGFKGMCPTELSMKSELDSSRGHAWIAKREVVAKSYVSKAGEFGSSLGGEGGPKNPL